MKWYVMSVALCVLLACCSNSNGSANSTETPNNQPSESTNNAPENTPAKAKNQPAADPYELKMTAPEKVAVGQEAFTQFEVTPKTGFKINERYPAKLTLSKIPDGTKVPNQKITKSGMQIEKMRLVVKVPFTAESPGEKSFEGEFRFSVCDEKTCQMPKRSITWTTLAEATAQ